MNVPASFIEMPMMTVPSSRDAAAAVREMQRLFARTLAAWAVDALVLRRSGMGEWRWHTASGSAMRPHSHGNNAYRKAA